MALTGVGTYYKKNPTTGQYDAQSTGQTAATNPEWIGAAQVNGSSPYQSNYGAAGASITPQNPKPVVSYAPKPAAAPAPVAPAAPPPNTPAPVASPWGSQSGPGLLEQWFSQRANGTDPGWEYAMGRGTAMLNRASAARGGFNSSAAFQGLSNLYANMGSQREAQLDELAGGASAEHQNRLNSMFNQGIGIAGGQVGAAQPYGMAAGGADAQAAAEAYQASLIQAGVDPAVAAQQTKDAFGYAQLGLQAYNTFKPTTGTQPVGGISGAATNGLRY